MHPGCISDDSHVGSRPKAETLTVGHDHYEVTVSRLEDYKWEPFPLASLMRVDSTGGRGRSEDGGGEEEREEGRRGEEERITCEEPLGGIGAPGS